MWANALGNTLFNSKKWYVVVVGPLEVILGIRLDIAEACASPQCGMRYQMRNGSRQMSSAFFSQIFYFINTAITTW